MYREDISNRYYSNSFKSAPSYTLEEPREHELRVRFHNIHIPHRTGQHQESSSDVDCSFPNGLAQNRASEAGESSYHKRCTGQSGSRCIRHIKLSRDDTVRHYEQCFQDSSDGSRDQQGNEREVLLPSWPVLLWSAFSQYQKSKVGKEQN